MASVTFWTSNSASTTDCTTTWTTAATDTISYTIHLGFQGFLQGIDYVREKIEKYLIIETESNNIEPLYSQTKHINYQK